jgi:hypothetical protein
MKHLVGKEIKQKVAFMGDKVEVKKLTVTQVLEVQKLVEENQKEGSEKSMLTMLKSVLRMAVVGAEELSDEDFDTFPLGELNALSEKVLSLSGLGDGASKGN